MPGRTYFLCESCDGFLYWSKDDPHKYGDCPDCKQGHRVRNIVKPQNLRNAGKVYFKCSKEDCRYFDWEKKTES
ncbi:Uu.00g118860.m01.CDS01 [Anthostomella pinea]|uniref:Uu.00g118860.m01.CDS01 n=1 Tax=Anthostomella pinea TaxID=933095 RepID=A0AAI8VB97_9PEZI|nr:Uu.00g118860.m01.CDS01 [Anthostomella pinea]